MLSEKANFPNKSNKQNDRGFLKIFMMIDGHRPHCQMSVGAELGSWEDGSSNTAGWQPEDDDLGEVLRWVHLVMIIVYANDLI